MRYSKGGLNYPYTGYMTIPELLEWNTQANKMIEAENRDIEMLSRNRK